MGVVIMFEFISPGVQFWISFVAMVVFSVLIFLSILGKSSRLNNLLLFLSYMLAIFSFVNLGISAEKIWPKATEIFLVTIGLSVLLFMSIFVILRKPRRLG